MEKMQFLNYCEWSRRRRAQILIMIIAALGVLLQEILR